MPTGLPVSRLINATVNLTPAGAQYANVNSLLIVGSADVIDVDTRVRAYADIDEVAAEFGTSRPEYEAARLFFSQKPQPTELLIGRWAQGATAGANYGGPMSGAQKALANFTGITNGGFKYSLNGGAVTNITGLNFAAATSLSGVASIINTALGGDAFATYDAVNSQFVIKSSTTGAASTISATTPPTAGIDIGPLINTTAAAGARLVGGIVAESALDAVVLMDGLPQGFYGLMFASPAIVDADHLAIAAYIEAAGNKHAYGVNTSAAGVLDPVSTADIASLLMQGGYRRTFVHYSSTSLYAAASFFGRALTTDFDANNSTITLMFKDEPTVTPESLTTTQANALQDKRANVFVSYDNNTAIIQYGTMAGDAYFDEIYGLDWLADAVQTDLFNLLYTSPTKIPQTDNGVNQLINAANQTLGRAVANGLVGPGVWQSGGFGELKTGAFLPSGFYVYAVPLAQQSPTARAARKSPPIQIAAKLAGAIHTVDVSILVNR